MIVKGAVICQCKDDSALKKGEKGDCPLFMYFFYFFLKTDFIFLKL